jgi:hypothetical protein
MCIPTFIWFTVRNEVSAERGKHKKGERGSDRTLQLHSYVFIFISGTPGSPWTWIQMDVDEIVILIDFNKCYMDIFNKIDILPSNVFMFYCVLCWNERENHCSNLAREPVHSALNKLLYVVGYILYSQHYWEHREYVIVQLNIVSLTVIMTTERNMRWMLGAKQVRAAFH